MLGVLLKSVTETCHDMMALFERGKQTEQVEQFPAVTGFLVEISLH